ncbi:response regulator transcription factor [Sphingomonas sp. M1-B02]|uniref:response regulator transcription factor n=1 Tax=Sphingomonas sp. M1-B02 TaxID=3114300 RepID=UPI00223F505F|nr:response regulator [Sphingomonas sp. S6-11]UZK66678.1 response regulator [Sphingomonas sp. S6-11]
MAYIIIADDDELVREVVREALLAEGHIVGAVDNGGDAWRAIVAKRPDMVILDCNMPEASGIIVLREMRNRMEFAATPVLILTGRRSQSDVDLAMYEGATAYMKKPFDPDQLVFRVEELLLGRT